MTYLIAFLNSKTFLKYMYMALCMSNLLCLIAPHDLPHGLPGSGYSQICLCQNTLHSIGTTVARHHHTIRERRELIFKVFLSQSWVLWRYPFSQFMVPLINYISSPRCLDSVGYDRQYIYVTYPRHAAWILWGMIDNISMLHILAMLPGFCGV